MGKTHKLRIKRKYYDLLLAGTKTLEIRVGYPAIKKIHGGDIVIFPDYSKLTFLVVRVARYDSFSNMADHEDLTKVVPRMSSQKVLEVLENIYTPDKESLGVYVIELELQFMRHLSKMQHSPSFKKIADELYDLTDWICDDYPYHFNHYYKKYLPGLKDGTREIIGYYRGTKPVGIIILKNTPEEKKICTLYVLENSRGMGIATKLVQEGISFLGTSSPVITIASHKLNQFSGLIKRFGWKHTQTLPRGYYNDHSEEYVYNSF